MDNLEIWKDIPDYEGLYQVSNLGNVKSLSRRNKNRVNQEKLMKLKLNSSGYLNMEEKVKLILQEITYQI